MRVVIVTGLPDDDLVAGASEVGASALVFKIDVADELPAAVLAA